MTGRKYTMQHRLDTTVALLAEGTLLETESLMTTVGQLEVLIALIKKGDEAVEALDKIRRYCVANAVPKDAYVRTKDHKPLVKNSTTRGETPELEAMTPRRRVKTERKGLAVDVLKVLVKKGTMTVTEISEALEAESSSVKYAVDVLMTDKTVKRFRLKKGEVGNTRYRYEVMG